MRERILTVAWLLLTLASLTLYAYHSYWLVQYFQAPPAALQNASAVSGVPLGLFAFFNALNQIGIYLPFFVTAQLIALRRRGEHFPLIAAVSLLAIGTTATTPAFPEFYEFSLNPPPWYAFLYALFPLLFALVVPFFTVSFPDGKLIPRWSIFAVLSAVVFNLVYVTNQGMLASLGGIQALGAGVVIVATYGSCVYVQVWRYRHYLTPLQRQQVKWFVFGAAITPILLMLWVILAPTWAAPDLSNPAYIPSVSFLLLSALGLVSVPISVGIAIFRYRLWDIDVLIRRTVTYALVAACLALVYFTSVIVLQQLFASVTGRREDLVTVLSTLASAALFVPLRNRIQNLIDKRFNRQKYDAQQVLNKFGESVRDETDLEKLTSELVNVVQETMQPKNVTLWLKPEQKGK